MKPAGGFVKSDNITHLPAVFFKHKDQRHGKRILPAKQLSGRLDSLGQETKQNL